MNAYTKHRPAFWNLDVFVSESFGATVRNREEDVESSTVSDHRRGT